jgi:prolyl oligopeptidase
MQPLSYPPTRRDEQVDNYHGVQVADPFRWQENADSAETRAWVEAQNRLTFGYLGAIPGRERIKSRLTQLWNYERFGAPFREGGRTFYFRNTGLQNQYVLYVATSPDEEGHILLDPNTLSPDGTVALASCSVSHDGRTLAYALSSAGSDWQEWKVRDIESGNDAADHLKWAKFSDAAWTADSRGFFYSRYAEPTPGQELQSQNFCHQIYYHRIGAPQAEDILVYHRPDQKEWFLTGEVTEDGRYLIIHAGRGTDPESRIFYKDLLDPQAPAIAPTESPVRPLLDAGDARYEFIANDETLFWFLTDRNAPRKRIVAIDIRHPEPPHWQEIVPEATETLISAHRVGDRFFADYMKDAHSQIRMFDLQGSPLGEVALPGMGTASGFGGKRNDRDTFYTFTSYTRPDTVYRYDIATGVSEILRQPETAFDADRYETQQVFYPGKDGTRIPMFLTYRKGLTLNGANPTLLYGYGGFDVSLTPYYASSIAVWLEMGGVYAVANLRGGGEYGEAWHQAGVKLKKQNVFDDFIAAAEWLIGNGYTTARKLAINGGSNGGLLVGACLTQRPDLFGAALPDVGVMDMLRFHKFTIGWGWTSDYGSPDDPEEFRALYAYSPLHNLRPGTHYPATLVTTSDHDDRVVPAHSYKFISALQAAQAGDAPVLIRIETDAGHGAGKPTSKSIEEAADRYAFLTQVLALPPPTFEHDS